MAAQACAGILEDKPTSGRDALLGIERVSHYADVSPG